MTMEAGDSIEKAISPLMRAGNSISNNFYSPSGEFSSYLNTN
jgi:hypothetical protein